MKSRISPGKRVCKSLSAAVRIRHVVLGQEDGAMYLSLLANSGCFVYAALILWPERERSAAVGSNGGPPAVSMSELQDQFPAKRATSSRVLLYGDAVLAVIARSEERR